MIPVSEPLITEREIELVLDCLKTGWISSAGKYIEQFEAGWAAYCGMRYGIAVSNGTTALQIAVRLLDLQPGDEVIMPTFTIISCAQAITYCGGKPVLVDSNPKNWQSATVSDCLCTGDDGECRHDDFIAGLEV